MLKRLRNKKKKRNRGDLIEDTTVNENLVKYIISVVGNYNKSLRNY